MVAGTRMRTPVRLTSNADTRATRTAPAAGAGSFSTSTRTFRRKGAPAAAADGPVTVVENSVADAPPVAAVAANAAIPNRNLITAHWAIDSPNKVSFLRALKTAGAHLIVVTFAFGGKPGQMGDFLNAILNDDSLEGCFSYVSLTHYDSDCAFVYRHEYIKKIAP